MIQKHRKNGNLYLIIAFSMMGLLFYSSSQTYEQQSQIGLLSRLLKNEPLKEMLSQISFSYAGSEVSIAKSGYFSFVEFFTSFQRIDATFLFYYLVTTCYNNRDSDDSSAIVKKIKNEIVTCPEDVMRSAILE